MLIVRDAQGLRDKVEMTSNILRDIAKDIYSGSVKESDVSGLLLLAATELDSTVNEYMEVESERSNSNT